MAQARIVESIGENRLLRVLPRTLATKLLSDSATVSLTLKEKIYEQNDMITHVYFPFSGVLSLVIESSNGGIAEIATVGNEGMVGAPILLGSDKSPTRIFCQVPGDVLKVPVKSLRRAVAAGGRGAGVLLSYVQALTNQVSQTVVCNSLHSIEKRMCRWLLMTHDRVDNDEFPLTQDFLSQMLGVRRPSVSIVARILYEAGLIRYARGRVTIVNRKKMEAAACECYAVVRDEYDRLLGSAAG